MRFPNLRYSSKYFAQIYRAQFRAAVLMYLRGTPTLRPENSVNIWNLLWLSRRLIISTEQTSIFISAFPNTLTSEWAKKSQTLVAALTLKSKMSRLLEKRKTATTTTTKAKENRLKRLKADVKILTHFTQTSSTL